ncbi:hypothetical protein IV203_037279 [Nitzschia inconspicua]|uniref:Uncharacterized protein n=1 Tax=Nitzschia inconspicua TaxID=303405 RepID=A0A9K3PY29_9STRA|nr:hypothetical protein IV203_037279 [Nitzschia inconspicua]
MVSSQRYSAGTILLSSLCILIINLAPAAIAFVVPRHGISCAMRTTSSIANPTMLQAKKKPDQTAKGFGKRPVTVDKPKSIDEVTADLNVRAGQSAPQRETFLTSVPDGSKAIPTIDETVPVQDRTNTILREKYGLRTREEQQAEYQRQQQAAEQRKKLEEWKELADRGEDFDLMKILPAPVLIFIDRFLKAGVAVCTVLFVAAGLGITVEAGSKATGNPLPENVDAFITNVVEPNFTPGLLVLLGFSVSLGAFAALQLSSASSTYREDR